MMSLRHAANKPLEMATQHPNGNNWTRVCPQCKRILSKEHPPDKEVTCECGWVWK
jgi:hypothetical protein